MVGNLLLSDSLLGKFVSFSLGLSVLLMLALLLRKSNWIANRLLCGIILIMTYSELIFFGSQTGRLQEFPLLLRSHFPLNILVSSLLYLYTCALTIPDFRLKQEHLWHLIPFASGILWYLSLLVFFRQYDLWTLSPHFYQERYFRMIFGLTISGYYFYLCFLQLSQYQKSIENYFSETRTIRLNWLRALLLPLLAIWLVGLIDVFLGPSVSLWPWMILGTTAMNFTLALFTLRQSLIFDPHLALPPIPPVVYNKPPLFSETELHEWRVKLYELMKNEKPYLNSNLRLSDLAALLNMKAYQLSDVLNRAEGATFYEFINKYRIEEVKKRLRDSQFDHLSLLGVALDSGFNSKSVFNDTFKRLTGQTPSEFRKGL